MNYKGRRENNILEHLFSIALYVLVGTLVFIFVCAYSNSKEAANRQIEQLQTQLQNPYRYHLEMDGMDIQCIHFETVLNLLPWDEKEVLGRIGGIIEIYNQVSDEKLVEKVSEVGGQLRVTVETENYSESVIRIQVDQLYESVMENGYSRGYGLDIFVGNDSEKDYAIQSMHRMLHFINRNSVDAEMELFSLDYSFQQGRISFKVIPRNSKVTGIFAITL